MMRKYGRDLFDKCLAAIASELQRAEEKHPEWPEDTVAAAQIIHNRAEKLLSAAKDSANSTVGGKNRIVEEAIETGAMALRFLLNIGSRQCNEMVTANEYEISRCETRDWRRR